MSSPADLGPDTRRAGARARKPATFTVDQIAELPPSVSDALFCFAVGALAALIVVAVLIYVQIGAGL